MYKRRYNAYLETMATQRQIEYNRKTSAELGWQPSWFGASSFDDTLIDNIIQFQVEHHIGADGLCGPGTFRRVYADRMVRMGDFDPGPCHYRDHIVYNGNFFPIKWKKVVHWFDDGGLVVREGAYSSYTGKAKRPIKMFVNHWDVCLDSKSCVRILNNRGVSVQFCIDNDGTIYQLMDMQNAAWHAGNRKVNHASVGVEISNAYYTKYQSTYVSKGFGERPVLSGVKVHKRELDDFLGFYPIQLEALAALWASVHACTEIPLALPAEDHTVSPSAVSGQFAGFLNHYRVTTNKIDCAGLDNKKILEAAVGLL